MPNDLDCLLHGNLTKQTQHVDGSTTRVTTTRVTTFTYDFRDRRTDTDGEVDFYEQLTYDNLDRVTKSERFDTTSTGNLIAKSETKFDDRGRVYQSVRYGVNPSTGTVGNSLTDNTWYDASGHVIKQLPAGSEQFTKMIYDSLGRPTTRYAGYDLDETTYADAGTVTGDTIMEQSESTYDDAGNVVQSTTRQRYHNAPASQTGELKNPSETPKARVTYVASYPDALGRGVRTANYGTNGGTTLVRSSTVPTGTDNILVSQTEYDSAGNMESSTDPSGMVTSFEHDDVGRETGRTMNTQASPGSSSSAGGCEPSVDTNVTVETSYNADGNVSRITAKNAATGDQVTEYVYGTTLSNSEIASSLLKRAEVYPDSVDGSDRITFEYNRQSQVTKQTDQGGTIHEYDFDKLGRQTHDRVTALDTGVDGAVRRISTSYEVRGMWETITSWNNASVTSGDVVNQVEFAYNDFGQLTADYQDHSAAVNVLTTPKVQYGYASGSDNTIRATTITYPDGRVITYDYDSTDSMSDALSRVAAIVDDDGSSTHLANYSYLGQSTFVETDYTEPDIKYTLIGTAGGNDPDTGDIYRGLDRFGRIVDSYWYDYGSSSDVDRIKYGYDRSGNRLWRENVVARSVGKYFDEKYLYDEIHRLKDMERGELTSGQSSITNLQFAQCWGLDETGNWSNFREDDDGNGSWNLNQDRTANKVNEISDITESTGPSWTTPAYSKAGNMTTVPKPADPTTSFTATYDAWNRLTKLVDTTSSDTVAEYEYDGAKRRTIHKSYDAGTLDETRHLYYTAPLDWQLIEQRLNSSSSPSTQFVWGMRYLDDLLQRDRDTTGDGTLDERLYAQQDANWNVVSLTESTGNVVQRISYTLYGAPTFLTSTFNPTYNLYRTAVLFSGYSWSEEAQLYSIRLRTFSSLIPSWLQRDPEQYVDGMNLYRPYFTLTTTDPFGTSVMPHGRPPCAVLLNNATDPGLVTEATRLGGSVRTGAGRRRDLVDEVARRRCCDITIFGHGSGNNPGGINSATGRILPDTRLEDTLRRVFRRTGCPYCTITLFNCEIDRPAARATLNRIAFRTGCTVRSALNIIVPGKSCDGCTTNPEDPRFTPFESFHPPTTEPPLPNGDPTNPRWVPRRPLAVW